MSITPGPPVPTPPAEPIVEASGTPRWIPITLAAAFILIGALAYGHYTDRQQLVKNSNDAQQQNQALAAELDKTNSRIASLQGQLQVTLEKLGMTQQDLAHARQLAQEISQQQKTSDARLRSQIGQVQQETTEKIGAVSSALTGTQTDVAATKKDLEDTKTQLQHTVGDLGVQSGLIAHNHEEVEELRRLGERNIFEFNLSKQKNPQRVGPIQIAVKKLDPKHYRYTRNVMADDKSIEKKDKTAGEPVQFYVQGARAPYEIVVFNINKDNMTGYLSTPKDASGGSAAPSSAPAKP
jgi:predicted outer membrane lipoprotein